MKGAGRVFEGTVTCLVSVNSICLFEAMHALKLPSLRPTLKVLEAVRVSPVQCSKEGNFLSDLQEKVQMEMRKHVDVNPRPASPMTFESAQEEQIKKAERLALDGWSSTSFHATGVAIAFVLAVLMILNSPMSTPTM